jgi:hypothetical protein
MALETTTTSVNDLTNASLTTPFVIKVLSEKGGLWRFAREWNLTANWASPVLSIPVENSYWGSANDDGAGVDNEFNGTEGTDLGNTQITTGAVTCTPGEYGVAHEITMNVTEDSVDAVGFYRSVEENMLLAINLAMTDDFCGLFAGLSNSSGSSGVNLSAANMLAAFQQIRTRATDADALVGILDQQQCNDLEDNLTSASTSMAVFAMAADRIIGAMPSADAGIGPTREVMKFRNTPIIGTGLTDTANTAADVVGAIFVPSTPNNDANGSTTFGMAWKRLPFIDTDKLVYGRSIAIVMTARAGFCEQQNDSGQALITDA